MPFSYANPTSGPSAGGIGWFNFGDLTINPGQTITGLTGTLNDGTTVTFDLTSTQISGTPRIFDATTLPTYIGAQFGVNAYTGIVGEVALQTQFSFVPGATKLTLSNIVVLDSNNNPVPNYTAIVADSESTGLNESWIFGTNAAPWKLLAQIGNQPSPTLTGLNTQTATLLGIDSAIFETAYVISSQNPTQLELTSSTLTTAGGRQAVSIGFATTRVKVQKIVAGRIDAADQFELTIGGTPNSTAITTGNASGLQTQTAEIFGIPQNTYTINEAMAAGSVSALSAYTTIISASNATPAGSIPPTGTLPINFTPAIGDNVTYTIYNAVPYTFNKTVDKAFSDIGEMLTYTVVIDNPNDFAVNNVQFIDPTPMGTTYAGNLNVTAAYTGVDPNSGLTITTIPANSSVTVTWQVQVNFVPPISTLVVNVAGVTVPGGNSGFTNMATTQIHTAYVTMIKSVDKVFAMPGDILTYTLTLNNAGNVAASNVVITDAVPVGVTFVAGSLTGATGTLPTLTLNAPIPAGGSSVVTYKVKVGSVVPNPNPVVNLASAVYTYTVDPNFPDARDGSVYSDSVSTLINVAKFDIVKSVDKAVSYIGDIITYQIAVTNTGNVPANNVVITDPIPNGTSLVPGSFIASVPYTPQMGGAIALNNPIAVGETVTITFKVLVVSIPNPNPAINIATATFTYAVDPQNPNQTAGTGTSNPVSTIVFRNNLGQQITDLISSVAHEQAALAAIANAEGAKIQKIVAMPGVTQEQLLCLNSSVSAMTESIAMLEAVLKQKLSVVECQISGSGVGCM